MGLKPANMFVKIFLFCFLFFASLLSIVAQTQPIINAQAGVVMDATTGTILFEKNGDIVIPPASLAKLMTIHIALNEVAAGNATLDEIVPLPRQSWAIHQPIGSSLMFLASGQIVTLRELILGLSIHSGNDAAVAVALRFAPSVEAFAEKMNQEARLFGLSTTHFVEPSGISEYNLTTAKEFARLSQFYIKLHPETLQEYHSVPEFSYPKVENFPPDYRYRINTITRQNRNNLLRTFEGLDGLKTGYIDESDYNIALTAERNNTRFIVVILGAPTIRERDDDGRTLLDWGFENFKTLRPEVTPLPPVRIWKGKENFLDINAIGVSDFTVEINRGDNLYWETELADQIIAPIPVESYIGTLILSDDLGELRRYPLVTSIEAERGGFFKRLWDSIKLFFQSFNKK